MTALLDADASDVSALTVRTLVRDRCSPELEEHYVELNNILININYPVHLAELDLLFSKLNDQNMDPTDIMPSVDEVMRMATERALNEIGVEFNPDIKIEMLVEAADILLAFDPTDTPSILVDMLDDTEDGTDAVCRLLTQLGTYEYEDWLPEILEIHVNFTKNIRNVCKVSMEKDQAITIDPTLGTTLLKRLSRLVKANKESLGAELGSMNIGLGASLESLYGSHVGRLIDLTPEQAVDQLYSLAVISGASFESAETSISDSLDDLCYDIDARRKAEQCRGRIAENYKHIFGGNHE